MPESGISDDRYYLVEKPGLPVASLGEADFACALRPIFDESAAEML